MAEQATKRELHRALVERVRDGAGRSSAEQRAQAFAGEGLAGPLDALIGGVVTRPVRVSDAAFAAAKAAGVTDDELFELVVCAAVGHSSRLYAAGLAALAEACGDGAV
ncbi:hypothetical protein ABT369_42420 [Dactylosporangium sp. NPDC000244]|uniref:hypothetical protein n=1 Tax=Dactylosporangium sp. NPDC000244 TaxID=3154365 RepID=UPI00331CC2E3